MLKVHNVAQPQKVAYLLHLFACFGERSGVVRPESEYAQVEGKSFNVNLWHKTGFADR